MHQGIPTIKGCGSLGCIYNVAKKYGEDNLKGGKIGQTINQTPTLGKNMTKF